MALVLVFVHILYLHSSGSTNPLRVEGDLRKECFYPFFLTKDAVSLVLVFGLLFLVVLRRPDLFTDPENFAPASPTVTPPHIQPEWYFLFAYAILRSIPSKLGGVVALVISIALL